MKRMLCVFALLSLCLLPVRAEEGETKYIALTFDDGPSGRFTTALLDGLAEREVHATFFLCGYRVEQFPTLTARISAEGHEIGSHSDRHQFMNEQSAAGVCADLKAAEETIMQAAGKRPTLLRPPGGIYSTAVLRETCCADLPVILWSVDPHDWCRSDVDGIVQDVTKCAKNGDIILMHDMSDSSVQAALRIIDALEARDFEFVTVSELAYLAGQSLNGCESYHSFPSAK